MTTPALLTKEMESIKQLTIASLQATVDEGASLSISDTLLSKAGSVHFYEFLLRKDAKVSLWSANLQPLAHGLHCTATLEGENADFSVKGLSTMQPYADAFVKVLAEHKAPTTKSSQFFKQVLSSGAKSTFEGKIYVHSEALLTEAYQKSAALLLSEHAYAIAKPNLEIFADDVKASHGATMSTLKDEEAHYLRTRGLSEVDARNLLIEGFSKELLQDMPDKNGILALDEALKMLVHTLPEA
jgi:Fe-S cluster assembly protein SufD